MNAKLPHHKLSRKISSIRPTTLLLFFCFFLTANSVLANVTILKATGGSISADKAANATSPAYTTLGNIRLTEGAVGDFAVGTGVTLTINAPAGWNFNTAASVAVTATAGRNITGQVILSKTSTVITVQFNVTGTTLSDVLTVTGVQVRATDGAKQSVAGNLTAGGTATIAGCAAGANLGTLRTTVGVARLVVTLPGQTLTDATTFAGSGFTGSPSVRTATTSFSITRITACDQFYNRVTTFTGAKTITYTGPSTAVSAPTFTTAVTFTSGNSTTTLTTTLMKAETTNITVTNGVVPGVASANFVVQPGTHSNFLVEANGGGNIPTQIAGTAFSLILTARDAQNNPNSSGTNIFTGTVSLTSTGTLTTGGGTSAAFVAGVLSGKIVNISNAGNWTITVTKTAGAQTGTSNTFTVENPVPTISSLSSPCKTTGSGNFTMNVNGTNFNSSTIIKVDGSNRVTTYVSPTVVQAAILASDMTVDAEKIITAFNPTPGGGTSSDAIMTVSTIPIISSQPTSQTLCAGANATFNVVASGFNISYQWKKDGIALTDGGNISGSNTSSLSITNATLGDASSNYTVSIQSACFSDVVSSSVALVVNPHTTSTQNISICNGATHILPDGASASVSGTYISVIANAAGCDSTITTNLTVILNTTSTQTLSICDGATHTLPDGATATVTGVYTSHIANAAGCDSTITTNLTVIPNTTSTQTLSICDGATHTLPDGATATVTGVYTSHISNAAGCDSTITTNLTVIPNTTSTQTLSICDGATHTLPDGATATVSGVYTSHIANAAGCDSTITTNLTVIPNTTSTQTLSICDGATHTLPDGATATVTGVYTSHIANAAGCDSTITTNLTVIPNTTSTLTLSICNGATHTLPDGATATVTGVYTSHIANAAGCDSTITTNLTVIPNTTSTQTLSICDGATHTLPDGATATTTGTYISHISNAAGCDSTITTNLTVIPNTTSTQVRFQSVMERLILYLMEQQQQLAVSTQVILQMRLDVIQRSLRT